MWPFRSANRALEDADNITCSPAAGQWWRGVREMHFLLGKAREAQGERIARNPGADAKRIEMNDIMTVAEIS